VYNPGNGVSSSILQRRWDAAPKTLCEGAYAGGAAMNWERELFRVLKCYEVVRREMERKTKEPDSQYFEGCKDTYQYVIDGLRELMRHYHITPSTYT
jgi:hypothetical protein